jgi:hypothetical protein
MASETFEPSSPIALDEKQARFILFSAHIRADGTAKPDAFIPHPYPDLSTTRHNQLCDEEIWERGESVASQRGKALLGRADVASRSYLDQGLRIQPAPIAQNPQHINIVGWPVDKPAQKMIAQLIAKNSKFKPAQVVSCNSAIHHIGKCISVEGVVHEILRTDKGLTLLNFDANFPNQVLTAWVHSSVTIPLERLSAFRGKRVNLTGKMELWKGTPNIQIFTLDQISSV